MATIRKRGDRYQAQVRKHGHKPFSKSFRTKKEAVEWAKSQEVVIERGGEVDTAGTTLADVVDRFKKENDLPKYQTTILDWWAGEMGHMKLSSLRRKHFIAARKKLQALDGARSGESLTPATVNRRMAAISAVLTTAMDEWEMLESNPARLKGLTEDKPKVEPLTPEQRQRLLAACRKVDKELAKAVKEQGRTCAPPALTAFVLAAMYSGARAGELMDLTWGDVNLTKGTMVFHDTKNGDTRVAPLQGEALEAVKALRGDVSPLPSLRVFQNSNASGVRFRYRPLWIDAKTRAGIPDFRFHDLRHDAASQLAMAGASLRELGEVLGHRSMQMVKRYSHFVDDHIADLGKRLEMQIKPQEHDKVSC